MNPLRSSEEMSLRAQLDAPMESNRQNMESIRALTSAFASNQAQQAARQVCSPPSRQLEKRKQKVSVELDKENVREDFSLNHSVPVLGPSAQPSSMEGALWLQKQLYEKSRRAMFYEMETLYDDAIVTSFKTRGCL